MLRYSYGYNPFIIVGRMLSENFGIQLQGKIACIGSVAVSMIASSAVDLGTTSGQVISKPMKLIFVISPLSIAVLRSKSKDWFTQNQNNVYEWSDICTLELLFSMS